MTGMDTMTDEEVIANGEKFVEAEISYSNGGDGLETVIEILSELIQYQINNLTHQRLTTNHKKCKINTKLRIKTKRKKQYKNQKKK